MSKGTYGFYVYIIHAYREYELIETEAEEVILDDTSVITFYGAATMRVKYQW
jgi:hypothetical protein